ncbi:phosphopantetheine-binding protein [Microbacterium sp. K27]|uniref:phosphopantetheine-binding protein n=1 Tax=Microbacterium sp. K27 TaxID=2305445 RepID=UPI00144494FF|nr:phosphopantetheine-binding protein [Microbacterium sp. K27]
MSPSEALERARALAAAVVPDDLTDVAGDEDLRDYGLDSVRVIGLLTAVRDAGGAIEYADVVGGTTLDILAAALASAHPPYPAHQEGE